MNYPKEDKEEGEGDRRKEWGWQKDGGEVDRRMNVGTDNCPLKWALLLIRSQIKRIIRSTCIILRTLTTKLQFIWAKRFAMSPTTKRKLSWVPEIALQDDWELLHSGQLRSDQSTELLYPFSYINILWNLHIKNYVQEDRLGIFIYF